MNIERRNNNLQQHILYSGLELCGIYSLRIRSSINAEEIISTG